VFDDVIKDRLEEEKIPYFLLVLGGSRSTKTYTVKSDWDYAAMSNEIKSIRQMRNISGEDNLWRIQILPSFDTITREYNKSENKRKSYLLYWWINSLENIMAHRVIYDDKTITNPIRSEIKAIPRRTIAERYFWLSQLFPFDKMTHRDYILSARLSLTGAYYIDRGIFEIDIDKLSTHYGITFDWKKYRIGEYIPTEDDLLRLKQSSKKKLSSLISSL